jgi:AcrR family transcriptional regulator
VPSWKPKDLSPTLFKVIRFELRKGDKRKLEILDSAIECLATRGIEHTTFEEIGRRIGIRKSHVAYHFPNMGDLIETAMRYVIITMQNSIVERVKRAQNWREAIEAQARGTMEWAKEFPGHAQVYILFCYQGSYTIRLRTTNREFREVGIARLTGILEPLAAESRVGPEVLHRVARRAQDLVFGAILSTLCWKSPSDMDWIIENTLKGEFQLIESELAAARASK